MNKNEHVLILFKYIVNFLLVISLFVMGYQIYLSMISFDPSFSTPLFFIVLADTYLFISLSAILFICNIRLKKQLITKELILRKFKISYQFKKHKLRALVVLSLSLSVLSVLIIVLIQPLILYHPNHSSYAYDQVVELNKYKTYEIKHNELTYHGFGYVDQNKVQPTIIYFGGNGESSAQTFYMYENNNYFSHLEGFNLIMIDYPGYGLSEGKTSDKNILDMASYVFDYISLLDYVNQDQIYIYGYSLGTGAATYIASVKDVSGLILIAPYTSIIDLYNDRLPIFKGLGSHLIIQEFDSINYAKNCNIKALIIASNNDKTIPINLSLELIQAFEIEPDSLIVNDEAHHEFLSNKDVIDKIVEYLNN